MNEDDENAPKQRCKEQLEEYWEVDGLMLCERHANLKMEMDIMAPDDDDEDEVEAPKGPEIICELAYIRDPKLFDRDAQTRRSKARAELKTQTGIYLSKNPHSLGILTINFFYIGWSDEQIEGWRIMLERNVCSPSLRPSSFSFLLARVHI